jgi:hypothetical protein
MVMMMGRSERAQLVYSHRTDVPVLLDASVAVRRDPVRGGYTK